MLGNDLSNSTPPRTLVHVSAVFVSQLSIDKVLGIIPAVNTEFVPHMQTISSYYQAANKGLRFDLFEYEKDEYPGDAMFDGLYGIAHPFNTFLTFSDIGNLSDYLLVNADVVQVIDPLHPMAFGAKSA